MVGIGNVRKDIREGFIRILDNAALPDRRSVSIDFPDLQVGGPVIRVLGGGNELDSAVMVKIRYGIIPGLCRVRLL